MANAYDSNVDPLWWYEPPQPEIPYYITTTSSNTFYWPLRDTRIPYPGDKESSGDKPKKEKKSKMGHNDDYRSDQQKIDDAVREAIAKPRREQEIARRVAAISALTAVLETAEVGTVLTFTRVTGKKRTDSYVAFLAPDVRNGGEAEPKWHVTGSAGAHTSYGWSLDEFLNWATTGDSLIQGVKVATEFKPVEL